MKKRLGPALPLAVCCFIFGAASLAQTPGGAQPPQAGQSPARPAPAPDSPHTTEHDPVPKFNMDYFVGEWRFESTLAESPLGAGGSGSGTETVKNVLDGRFWEVTIKGQDDDGPFSGTGILIAQDTFAGQAFTRYEVSRGLPLLKTGTLGCDLGGNCNLYFETPPFEHKGSLVRLKGRYFVTSPVSYRVLFQISVDKGEYVNIGTIAYRKNESVKLKGVK